VLKRKPPASETPKMGVNNQVQTRVDNAGATNLFQRILQSVRTARERIARERKEGKQDERAA
jgi:hypothetical protein